MWHGRAGQKTISRNILGNGNMNGQPNGFKAKTVLSLVGFDPDAQWGCQCIHQGQALGYIHRDAKIYGVENDSRSWDGLEAHAKHTGMDLDLFRGELADFVPPRKIDMAIIDLMCPAKHWVGQYLRDTLVPMMKSRRAGIGINLNVQHTMTTKDYKTFVAEYDRDPAYWKAIWGERYQTGVVDPDNPVNQELYTGVSDFKLCLPTFVGIHMYMRETDFVYRGCYRYHEYKNETKRGLQNMLSLRYERK